MIEEIRLKAKTVSLNEFYSSYLTLTSYLPKKFAETLAILMVNHNNSVIDESIKVQIKKVLGINGRKEEYQNQMVSKALSYLTSKGYLSKIQNGVYELTAHPKTIIRKLEKLKEKDQININFSFILNEL